MKLTTYFNNEANRPLFGLDPLFGLKPLFGLEPLFGL